MAALIATELITLLFAMGTLSSVRAFVEGEGLYSKAQKNAIQSLYQFAATGEEKYYQNFKKNLEIPMGDRKARLELLKKNFDFQTIHDGFMQGGNHPNDIDGMIKLLTRFNKISYIHDAIDAWTKADMAFDDLMQIADDLHRIVRKQGYRSPKVIFAIARLAIINDDLTKLETAFSSSLGAGSRWLEDLLMKILALVVLSVEGTGLYLIYRFGRNLSRSLKELTDTAKHVGRGDFSKTVPVHSKDELGQLAMALNDMIMDLKTSIGERKLAENANQVKSIFLANMSHEIRTPLGVILGFVEVLKGGKSSRAEEVKYLDIIEQTGKKLNRIINDILDISKVESGHLEMETNVFAVRELFDELNLLFEMKARQGRNKIVFKVDEKAPQEIATDRLRLQQILINLIGNAIRFTDAGLIAINYFSEGTKLHFTVNDTGAGMTEEQIPKIFQLFSQADQSRTRKHGGTGLGLILSKKLAQAMGGDVVLKNTSPNLGSTFLVTIANEIEKSNYSYTAVKDPGSTLPFDVEILKGKKVLVVDDSPDNQLLLKVLLGKAGIEVANAENGELGAKKALSNNFDMILMDIQMPVLDGYEATSKLRKLGYTKPIIALTANAMKEDQKQCMAVGCNDYITKPIEVEKLFRSLVRNLEMDA